MGEEAGYWWGIHSSLEVEASAMTLEIEKSPNDGRLYRSLRLPNGINVLLIHDPEAASAAGTAQAGDGTAAGHTHATEPHDEELDSLVSSSDGESGSDDDEEGSEEVCRSTATSRAGYKADPGRASAHAYRCDCAAGERVRL